MGVEEGGEVVEFCMIEQLEEYVDRTGMWYIVILSPYCAAEG